MDPHVALPSEFEAWVAPIHCHGVSYSTCLARFTRDGGNYMLLKQVSGATGASFFRVAACMHAVAPTAPLLSRAPSMQVVDISGKPHTTVCDACVRNSIHVNVEKRLEVIRLLRSVTPAVSATTNKTALILVPRASALLQLLGAAPGLIAAVESLRIAAPPPVYQRAGVPAQPTFFDARHPDRPSEMALRPVAPPLTQPGELPLPPELPVVFLSAEQLSQGYGIPIKKCPRPLRAQIADFARFSTVPYNAAR